MGINLDDRVVGSVFRFVNEKQPRLWVETMAEVCAKYSDVHGVVVGGGGLRQAAKEYAEELGVADKLHFPGQTRLVKAWLNRVDLFLLTSKVEGLPNVLIEAQGFGVPVVSTDAGGSGETFLDNISGHLVTTHESTTLAEAISSALDDEDWLRTASVEAKKHARSTFSTKAMIKNLLEIYRLSLER